MRACWRSFRLGCLRQRLAERRVSPLVEDNSIWTVSHPLTTKRERGGACHKEDGGRKISFGISPPSRVITGVYYRGTKEEEKSPSFFVPLNEQLTSREREKKEKEKGGASLSSSRLAHTNTHQCGNQKRREMKFWAECDTHPPPFSVLGARLV